MPERLRHSVRRRRSQRRPLGLRHHPRTREDLAAGRVDESDRAFAAVAVPAGGDVLLVVGPEGGISDREITTLTTAGAIAVRLGDTVLRSSTAGAAALAVLSVRAGRW